MYLYPQLLRLAEAEKPVRVGLIGAGKFGSMFLSQVPTTPGLVVSYITDLHPDNARGPASRQDGQLSRLMQFILLMMLK